MTRAPVDLMLDSGIFSAWTHGEQINIKKYIEYVKENKKYLFSYVNVDVIPGAFGAKRTPAQVEDSAKRSYANLQIMKAEGLKPMPVFHQGETFGWLEKMLTDGEPYIGLSTAKDLPVHSHRLWLDTVFSVITNGKGEPLIKTHGFGITRPGLIFRYPWFSCDSTTWTLTPGYGQIWVPVYTKGKADYSRPPMLVIFSDRERKASGQATRFDVLGEGLEQPLVVEFLKTHGIDLSTIRYSSDTRRKAMLAYFVAMQKKHKVAPFKHQIGTFALSADFAKGVRRQQPWDRVNIMLATNLSRSWAKLMNEAGANQRLLSYFELKDRDSQCLVDYVTKGTIGKYVRRPIKADWRSSYVSSRQMGLAKRIEEQDAS